MQNSLLSPNSARQLSMPPFLRLSLFRGDFQVPSKAQQGKGADNPEAYIDLPPAQAMASRGREGMVRIVPPLPHCQDAKQRVVPALVVAPIWLVAPQVAGRIDTPRHMM